MSNQHSKCDDCYKSHLPEAHDRIILPSEAFGEGYVPEFNQASEDEPINQHLVCLWQLQDIEVTIADAAPEELVDLHSKLVALSTDITEAVQSAIRTEKLKLLDEVIHQSTVNLKSAKAVAGWAELRKKQLEAEL